MLQIFDALFETLHRFGGEYGPPMALAVVAFVGCGLLLHIIRRVLGK
jgi:hypothetical protein